MYGVLNSAGQDGRPFHVYQIVESPNFSLFLLYHDFAARNFGCWTVRTARLAVHKRSSSRTHDIQGWQFYIQAGLPLDEIPIKVFGYHVAFDSQVHSLLVAQGNYTCQCPLHMSMKAREWLLELPCHMHTCSWSNGGRGILCTKYFCQVYKNV